MENQNFNENRKLSFNITVNAGWGVRLIAIIASILFLSVAAKFFIQDNAQWFNYSALGLLLFSFWGVMKHLADHKK